MKRSSPRSLPTLAFAALMLLASSCSLLDVPNEVGIRAVPVDLNFGASKLPKFVQPTLQEIPPAPIIDLPDFVDEKPKPTPPPPEICPVTTALGPDNGEARGQFTTADDMPREGPYFAQYEAYLTNGSFNRLYGYKEVSAEENAEATGFTFTVHDEIPGVTAGGNAVQGMDLTFEAVYTRPEPEPDGLSLTRIVLRGITDDGEYREYPFTPNPPLALVEFPIVQGTKLTRDAIDVEGKDEAPITNPITGQPVLTPSGNNMKSVFEIGGREIIEVCADLAQAWRANWNLEIAGDFNVTMSGTFWFDTSKGMGGIPIRNDYVLTGDISGGAFASSILRIDPGVFA